MKRSIFKRKDKISINSKSCKILHLKIPFTIVNNQNKYGKRDTVTAKSNYLPVFTL